jgi:hypothetical protein
LCFCLCLCCEGAQEIKTRLVPLSSLTLFSHLALLHLRFVFSPPHHLNPACSLHHLYPVCFPLSPRVLPADASPLFLRTPQAAPRRSTSRPSFRASRTETGTARRKSSSVTTPAASPAAWSARRRTSAPVRLLVGTSRLVKGKKKRKNSTRPAGGPHIHTRSRLPILYLSLICDFRLCAHARFPARPYCCLAAVSLTVLRPGCSIFPRP